MCILDRHASVFCLVAEILSRWNRVVAFVKEDARHVESAVAPVNQVRAGGAVERAAPAKGHVRPLRAALNSIPGRAPPSDGAIDADSARTVELAE